MTAYYNEIDPYAAQWLRNLIEAGHIAPGIVDERSIEDVTPNELKHYTQCHFFAGIGVWSLALRRAGWPDDRPVWTGSCPCQPFSSAGKGGGFDDERHLWPAFHHLIEQCRPATVIGEQVASKDAEPWLDLVQADLEAVGYAFGAVPFPSASVGAPHIRDRLYWVADATSNRWGRQGSGGAIEEGRQPRSQRAGQLSDGLEGHGAAIGLADTQREGLEGWSSAQRGEQRQDGQADALRTPSGLADTDSNGRREGQRDGQATRHGYSVTAARGDDRHNTTGSTNGFWETADWLLCRDGKWRPVEPGTFPLAHGATARVGRLRAYGNAINAEAARVFIESMM
jgi:DNA (cytosine-5)-methyltransferase 1